MTPQKGLTQETMVSIDSNETIISTDIIKAIKEIALDGKIPFRYMNQKARIDSEIIREISLTAHAQKPFSLRRLTLTLEQRISTY